jgi:hypothetical protein
MRPARRPRTSLARLMILNAMVAIVLGASRLGFADVAEYGNIAGSASACLLLALVLDALLDAVIGIRCPRCQAAALRRLARPFSLVSYFQCSGCGNRCKRTWPVSRWRDASGPEDDAKYRRKSAAGRWIAYSMPEENDSMGGTLLRNKRNRVKSRRSYGSDAEQANKGDGGNFQSE